MQQGDAKAALTVLRVRQRSASQSGEGSHRKDAKLTLRRRSAYRRRTAACNTVIGESQQVARKVDDIALQPSSYSLRASAGTKVVQRSEFRTGEGCANFQMTAAMPR
jgi:hypothetical protein